MNPKFDIAVVGGGAAGLMAAIAAAQECKNNHIHAKIAVLESNPRVGKKLLATGNGRCNLTNMDIGVAHYHGDTKFLPPLFKLYSPQYIIDYFASLGLLCKEQDEGRVYPYNFQASAVLDIFRLQLENYGVESICDFAVRSVKKAAFDFEICAESDAVSAKCVIFAAGGMAYPQLGSDGSGFQILTDLGHSVTRLLPALVQVKTDPKRAKPLKGARSAAVATLFADGEPVKTVTGEVQFTENGLSGICIFELSRLVGELKAAKKMEVALDLMREYTAQQIFAMLKHTSETLNNLPVNDLLSGYLNKLVGREIIRETLLHAPKYAYDLKASDLATIANRVKNFRFTVISTLTWKDAQITAGGVPLKEVDENMQSRCCPGLYLAGELLNIDGDCGGFNLHWAWSSGIASGRAAAQSLLEK